ncbi:MAG: FAD-dependent oxidoreductase [Tissierellia bacterium]|nr:FAD-dependent oxidoreductase [Tissierellia bacterium]
MDRTEYLIIGSGIAGYSATKMIRHVFRDSMITVVTKNKSLDKYEGRLSSRAYDDFEEKDNWMLSTDWYYDNDIELITDANAVKLDTDKKIVYLDNSREIQYRKLLIATGSRVVQPVVEYGDKENVIIIKTPQDLIYEEFVEPKNIVILGASNSGISEALLLHKIGKNITIIEHGDTILYPALNVEISEIIAKDLAEMGIKILKDGEIKEFVCSDKIEKIITSKGDEIAVDLMVLNKGIKSNIEFIAGSKVDYDIGIRVDERLQTNIEDVYAAGDCVEFDNQLVGQWDSSLKQGRIAGYNMTGGNRTYRYPDEIKILEIDDKTLFSFGRTSSDKCYKSEVKGDTIYQLFYDSEDMKNLIGIVIYGDISDKDKYVERILVNKQEKI